MSPYVKNDRYEELKRKAEHNQVLETKNQVQSHTNKYIHIPRPALWPLLGTILTALLSIGWFKVLTYNYYYLGIDTLINSEIPSYQGLHQWTYPPSLLVGYVLAGCFFLSVAALIKGGYGNLKSFEDEGLTTGLIGGLISGLILGLIFGLTSGLIGGLIVGLILGLIFGLIVGLIFGLIGEFL